MNPEWIRTNLPLTLEGDVLLRISDFGGIYSVAVQTLAEQFAGVEPTYETMKAHDAANNLGYAEAIERWRAEGRI